MFSFCIATVLVCTPSLCEEANKELFEQWGTTLHIPEITIGVPTAFVKAESYALLDSIYEKFVVSTRGELTSKQRELDVPFAMGMIEGIHASQGDEVAAKLCLKHLSELEESVTNWSASRLWRMRLHAYVCLQMDEEIQLCIEKIEGMKNADVEDQLVAALAVKQAVLSQLDQKLVLQNRNDLRWFLACAGAARHRDGIANIFSVTDDLVKLGVERNAMDAQLIDLLGRLDPPVAVLPSSPRKNLSVLALRVSAYNDFKQKEYVLAKEKSLKLIESGCAFSAQQILVTPEIELQQHEATAAIDLVLQKPSETSYELSYWQLFAGSYFARTGKKNKASACLQSVSSTSPYFEEAQSLLTHIRGSDVHSLQTRIDQLAKGGNSIVGIIEEIQPAAAKQLLQHYVGVWHKQGIMQNPWLSNVVISLLDKTTTSSPALLGEANRLLGRVQAAKQFLEQAKREQGCSLQVAVGLAACNRDSAAMQSATRGLVLGTTNEYWFWLGNSHLIQWYCEDGGNTLKAQAKVNRLKQLDPALGGEQFASIFRDALR